MIAKVQLLKNFEEVEKYDAAIKEYGKEEAFNLGLYTEQPKEIYISRDFLFKAEDLSCAWKTDVEGKSIINIKMRDGDTWTLLYTDEVWDKIKKIIK